MKTIEERIEHHSFEKELATYEVMKPELLKASEGKFGAFKNDEFLGVFDTFEEAYKAGLMKWGIVPMFIQQIERIERVAEIPLLFSGLLDADA